MRPFEHASEGEAQVARALLKRIFALPGDITVTLENGGGDTEFAFSSASELEAEMAATGEDELIVYQDGRRLGWILLVYGNDPDGSELIADHTYNQKTCELCKSEFES